MSYGIMIANGVLLGRGETTYMSWPLVNNNIQCSTVICYARRCLTIRSALLKLRIGLIIVIFIYLNFFLPSSNFADQDESCCCCFFSCVELAIIGYLHCIAWLPPILWVQTLYCPFMHA